MDHIDLQHSHVTQHTKNGHEKTPWRVCKNITNLRLGELPKQLAEAEVFDIMAFAKKYELIAFNEGIAFGKRKTVKVYDQQMKILKNRLNLAIEENERLASVLDKLTRKEV